MIFSGNLSRSAMAFSKGLLLLTVCVLMGYQSVAQTKYLMRSGGGGHGEYIWNSQANGGPWGIDLMVESGTKMRLTGGEIIGYKPLRVEADSRIKGRYLTVGPGNSTSNVNGHLNHGWSAQVHAHGEDYSRFLLSTDGGTQLAMNIHRNFPVWGANAASIGTATNHNLHFLTNQTSRMILTTAGHVGIGTMNPDDGQGWNKLLHIRGVSHSKMMTSTTGGVKGGVYSHDNWSGVATYAIGTESQHPLKFMTGYAHRMILTTDGKLGVGTQNPQETLHVEGNIRGGFNNGGIKIQGTTGYVGIGPNNAATGIDFYTDKNYYWFNKQVALAEDLVFGSDVKIGTNSTERLRILASNGNMGVGVASPSEKLHVAGTVKATSFVSSAGSFPDYVFADDYRIMPLDELENYINENSHLPNMPAESEVVKNGLNVPEVVTKSVENIETIYLHLIRMEKELQALKEENARLKKAVEQTK